VSEAIKTIPGLRKFGLSASRSIHDAVLRDEAARRFADVLHGTWLGHPLHPMLTDIVVGAWSLGALLDVLSLSQKSSAAERIADQLNLIGTLTAVPTALSGLADYSTIPRSSVEHGTLHGLINATAQALHVLSLVRRWRGDRGAGIALGMAGTSLVTFGGWLGGELVFRHRVGVNRNDPVREPQKWTPVGPAEDLLEGEPRRVEVEGRAVLLYRFEDQVYAISAVCGHAGGPLEEGEFDGACVMCPWHQSVFDVRDGSVVHGPATYAQPAYLVRVRSGQIELRADVPEPAPARAG
jgi:nitrite reductase/ring-hydroxylating ferredoxin subunit/uncharacterized membrane protein